MVNGSSWVGVVARWHGLDEQIQAGEFALNAPLTAGEFIAKWRQEKWCGAV